MIICYCLCFLHYKNYALTVAAFAFCGFVFATCRFTAKKPPFLTEKTRFFHQKNPLFLRLKCGLAKLIPYLAEIYSKKERFFPLYNFIYSQIWPC